MEREYWAEFEDLRKRAEEIVRAGEWSLRLEQSPSFGDVVALGVVESGEGVQVLERRWGYGVDVEKFRTPVERLKHGRSVAPTVLERRVGCDRTVLAGIRQELAEVRVQALPPLAGFVTCDGVRYTVMGESLQSQMSFSWLACPPGWLPLAAWFGRTWRALAGHLGQNTETTFPWEHPQG